MRTASVRTWLTAASAAALLPATAQAKGMPQLDFANPLTISQIVWGAIIFVLFYLLLSRWALPKVATVVDARHASIAGDLETARSAKAEADAAVTELTEAVRRARAEAQAAVASATQMVCCCAAPSTRVALPAYSRTRSTGWYRVRNFRTSRWH